MHVVVTAGHAGSGKSALLRALTVAAPGRPGDQRRATPADAGFEHLVLPAGDELAVVDVPGHDRLAGLLAGPAGPAAAVLFVVAADQGWTEQAAEQLGLISALGISHGVLAVTKAEVADPGPPMTQAAANIAATGLGSIPAVAVSSVTGAGLAELVSALEELARSLPEPDEFAPVRIWIDRVAGLPEAGRAAGGSVAAGGSMAAGLLGAGTVRVGDRLLVTPSMRPVRVREVQSSGQSAAAAAGFGHLTLGLSGVGRDALHRGMALIQPGQWTLTDVIDVRVKAGAGTSPVAWLAGEHGGDTGVPGPLSRAAAVHIGSARVLARVRPLGHGLARLSLAEPLPLHPGDLLLLRDPGSRRAGPAVTATGAVVLDVAPPPLTRRGAAAAAARLLASWPDRPGAAELLARHGIIRASTLLAMGIDEHPVPVVTEWLADPERWRALSHQLGELLASHAAAEPLSGGVPIDTARAALDLPDRRLVQALARAPFRISCGMVQIVRTAPRDGSVAALPEPVQAAIRVLRADLAAAPFVSPDSDRLRKLGLDARSIAAAVRAGELMRISEHVVLAPGADVAAAAVLAGLEQPFTAAQARQALATTRRTAIPLLEYLDSVGVTERLPDDRRMLRRTPPVPAARSAPAGQATDRTPADAAGDTGAGATAETAQADPVPADTASAETAPASDTSAVSANA